MATTYKPLAVTLVFVCLLPWINCLNCYVCSSANSTTCGDPWVSTVNTAITCATNVSSFCTKTKTTTSTEDIVTRDCSNDPGYFDTQGCEDTEALGGIKTYSCYCSGDACNAGHLAIASSTIIFATTLLTTMRSMVH